MRKKSKDVDLTQCTFEMSLHVRHPFAQGIADKQLKATVRLNGDAPKNEAALVKRAEAAMRLWINRHLRFEIDEDFGEISGSSDLER